MRIVFLNGSEFRGSSRDFIRALWHPLFVGLVLGMTCVILVLGPYDKFLPDVVMTRTMIICSAVIAYLAVLVWLFMVAHRRQIAAHTLPVMFMAVVAASTWGVGISALLGGNALALPDWVQLLGFNITMGVLAEIFLASFLLPKIAREVGMQAYPIKAYVAPQKAETGAMQAKPPPPLGHPAGRASCHRRRFASES
jgi:hypothetical protein